MKKEIRHDQKIPLKRFIIMSIFVVFLMFLFSHMVDISHNLSLFNDINDIYVQKFSELLGVVIVTMISWRFISLQ